MNIINILFGYADPSHEEKVEAVSDSGESFVAIHHNDDTWTAGITDREDTIAMPVFGGTKAEVNAAYATWTGDDRKLLER